MKAPVMFYVNADCPAIDLNVLSIAKITNNGTNNFAVLSDGSSYQINDATLNAFWDRYNVTIKNAVQIVF